MPKIYISLVCAALWTGYSFAEDAPLEGPPCQEICTPAPAPLFIVDWKFSPYMGATDFLLIHQDIEKWEDRLLKNNDCPKRSFGWGAARLGELIFIWAPINETMMLVQHEFFGHGYRIRSLGEKYARVTGYKIGWPPPYGSGGGATYLDISSNLSTSQEMCIDSAGVEANAIFANRIKLNWLERGKIDPKQASLYLTTEHDLTQYVWSLDDSQWLDFENGHDIESYLFWLKVTYPTAHLSKKQLRMRSLVNFIDPFTFYSVYAWFYYIFTGKQSSIPLFRINDTQFMPNARLGLTPFGPEYYAEVFGVKERDPFYLYLRAGHYAKNTFWGIGFEEAKIWKWKKGFLGMRFDFWRQPHYATNKKVIAFLDFMKRGEMNAETVPFFSERGLHSHRYGGALSAIGSMKLGNSPFSLYAQIGYKTIGFLPGEAMQPAPIARIGLISKF